MSYRVQPGDSLSSIAAKMLHDERRWSEIARLNSLITPDHLLVGQLLRMPGEEARNPPPGPRTTPSRPAWVPANFHLFVLADEVNPLRGKVIRRVLVNPKMTAAAAATIGRPLSPFPHPERFGFSPSAPGFATARRQACLGHEAQPLPFSIPHPATGGPSFHGNAFLDRRGESSGRRCHLP